MIWAVALAYWESRCVGARWNRAFGVRRYGETSREKGVTERATPRAKAKLQKD